MHNKIYTLVLIVTLLLFNKATLTAQPLNWQWVQSSQGIYLDKSASVAVDANGNSYITGYYESDSIKFGSTILINLFHSSRQIFIAKYDAAGNALWAKTIIPSSPGLNYGKCIAVDANGNVYLTGDFQSKSITIGSTVLTNSNQVFMQSEVFIAKYDTYGNPIWAKSLAGTSDDEGNGIALDPSGNPVITGYFLSYPYLIDTINLVNSGLGTGADLFVAKFDTAGNVIWAKTAYGNIHDVVGNAIAMDQNGNALITGYYSGDSAYFDTITLTNGHAVNADIFIVKYDTGGNVIWVNKADGLTNDDIGISITADANGNAYATGYYKSSSIFFDNDTLINSSGGYPDIFIVKLDGQGNTVWAKTAGGSGEDSPFSIAVDANQNVYIAGGFNVNAVSYFDTITLSNPSGYVDLFLVKYDSTGHAQWAMAGGNSATASTVAFAIALSASGDLYITGNFGCDTLTFGNVSLPHTTISNDVFLAKASTGITTSIVQQHHSSNTIAIYPNPGNGNFNIESAGLIDDIKITTVQGQIIYHAKPLDKTVAITLKQEGIYFVTVESNHQTTTSKLVVQE